MKKTVIRGKEFEVPDEVALHLESIESDLSVQKEIVSRWIDTQIVDSVDFPTIEKLIREKNETHNYYERQIKEAYNMFSKNFDAYFKLLKECNQRFDEIQKLKKELNEVKPNSSQR